MDNKSENRAKQQREQTAKKIQETRQEQLEKLTAMINAE